MLYPLSYGGGYSRTIRLRSFVLLDGPNHQTRSLCNSLEPTNHLDRFRQSLRNLLLTIHLEDTHNKPFKTVVKGETYFKSRKNSESQNLGLLGCRLLEKAVVIGWGTMDPKGGGALPQTRQACSGCPFPFHFANRLGNSLTDHTPSINHYCPNSNHSN